MKGVMKKMAGSLAPACSETQEALEKLSYGELVMVEIKKSRSPGNHRRFFKLVGVTMDMQEDHDNKNVWRKVLQMIGGHFDEVVLGRVKCEKCNHVQPATQYWPKSIAFDEMEELEFRELFKDCIGGFLKRYGKGMTEEEFMRVVHFD